MKNKETNNPSFVNKKQTGGSGVFNVENTVNDQTGDVLRKRAKTLTQDSNLHKIQFQNSDSSLREEEKILINENLEKTDQSLNRIVIIRHGKTIEEGDDKSTEVELDLDDPIHKELIELTLAKLEILGIDAQNSYLFGDGKAENNNNNHEINTTRIEQSIKLITEKFEIDREDRVIGDVALNTTMKQSEYPEGKPYNTYFEWRLASTVSYGFGLELKHKLKKERSENLICILMIHRGNTSGLEDCMINDDIGKIDISTRGIKEFEIREVDLGIDGQGVNHKQRYDLLFINSNNYIEILEELKNEQGLNSIVTRFLDREEYENGRTIKLHELQNYINAYFKSELKKGNNLYQKYINSENLDLMMFAIANLIREGDQEFLCEKMVEIIKDGNNRRVLAEMLMGILKNSRRNIINWEKEKKATKDELIRSEIDKGIDLQKINNKVLPQIVFRYLELFFTGNMDDDDSKSLNVYLKNELANYDLELTEEICGQPGIDWRIFFHYFENNVNVVRSSQSKSLDKRINAGEDIAPIFRIGGKKYTHVNLLELLNFNNKILRIDGKSGTGKSYLLTYLNQLLLKNSFQIKPLFSNKSVFPIYLDLSGMRFEEIINKIDSFIENAPEGPLVYLLLDSLDESKMDSEQRNKFIDKILSLNCKSIISARSGNVNTALNVERIGENNIFKYGDEELKMQRSKLSDFDQDEAFDRLKEKLKGYPDLLSYYQESNVKDFITQLQTNNLNLTVLIELLKFEQKGIQFDGVKKVEELHTEMGLYDSFVNAKLQEWGETLEFKHYYRAMDDVYSQMKRHKDRKIVFEYIAIEILFNNRSIEDIFLNLDITRDDEFGKMALDFNSNGNDDFLNIGDVQIVQMQNFEEGDDVKYVISYFPDDFNKIKEYKDFISRQKFLYGIEKNPLTLSMICDLMNTKQGLLGISTKTDLYERVINKRLWEWEISKGNIVSETKVKLRMQLLYELANFSIVEGEDLTLDYIFDKIKNNDFYQMAMEDEKGEINLNYINLMFRVDKKGVCTFVHESFKEYFFAAYYSSLLTDGEIELEGLIDKLEFSSPFVIADVLAERILHNKNDLEPIVNKLIEFSKMDIRVPHSFFIYLLIKLGQDFEEYFYNHLKREFFDLEVGLPGERLHTYKFNGKYYNGQVPWVIGAHGGETGLKILRELFQNFVNYDVEELQPYPNVHVGDLLEIVYKYFGKDEILNLLSLINEDVDKFFFLGKISEMFEDEDIIVFSDNQIQEMIENNQNLDWSGIKHLYYAEYEDWNPVQKTKFIEKLLPCIEKIYNGFGKDQDLNYNIVDLKLQVIRLLLENYNEKIYTSLKKLVIGDLNIDNKLYISTLVNGFFKKYKETKFPIPKFVKEVFFDIYLAQPNIEIKEKYIYRVGLHHYKEVLIDMLEIEKDQTLLLKIYHELLYNGEIGFFEEFAEKFDIFNENFKNDESVSALVSCCYYFDQWEDDKNKEEQNKKKLRSEKFSKVYSSLDGHTIKRNFLTCLIKDGGSELNYIFDIIMSIEKNITLRMHFFIFMLLKSCLHDSDQFFQVYSLCRNENEKVLVLDMIDGKLPEINEKFDAFKIKLKELIKQELPNLKKLYKGFNKETKSKYVNLVNNYNKELVKYCFFVEEDLELKQRIGELMKK